jgi:hypothetical protein
MEPFKPFERLREPGTNISPICPEDGRMVIIEMNPGFHALRPPPSNGI